VTGLRALFQPFGNVSSEPLEKISLMEIQIVVSRRYLLQQTGCEVFLAKSAGVFFNFDTSQERDSFIDRLMTANPSILSGDSTVVRSSITRKWQQRELNNFDYIMQVNSWADRTTNDLAQYPVFPWILTDYRSSSIDLTDPKIYRDLSLPIGALNPKRLLFLFCSRIMHLYAHQYFLTGLRSVLLGAIGSRIHALSPEWKVRCSRAALPFY
jgi:factor associated with neutral sphingomyelinase activation